MLKTELLFRCVSNTKVWGQYRNKNEILEPGLGKAGLNQARALPDFIYKMVQLKSLPV